MFWNAAMPQQVLGSQHDGIRVKHDPSEMVQQLNKSFKSGNSQQQREGLDLLARAAAFSETVKASERKKFKTIKNNFRIESGEWFVPNPAKEIGAMAVGLSTQPTDVYYIVCHTSWGEVLRMRANIVQEWKSYRTYGGVTEEQLVANIGSLVKIASIPAPAEFRLLPCLGAFRASDQRYGLVYDLPNHLRSIWESKRYIDHATVSRKPKDLLSLIRDSEDDIPEDVDLGTRIAWIRKIAQSLLLLHAVGWVHKK